MRTADQFVADMLKKKRSWSAILAVARQARGGKWREEVRAILIGKGLVPSDHIEELSQRDKMIEEQRNFKARKEEEEKAKKPKPKERDIVAKVLPGEKDGTEKNNTSGGMRRGR